MIQIESETFQATLPLAYPPLRALANKDENMHETQSEFICTFPHLV